MPIARAVERCEERRDAVLRPACRLYARAAAETGRFYARVLAGDPCVARRVRACVTRLDAGVLLEGVPVLGRWIVRLPGFDLPAGERATELFDLVRIGGGDEKLHRVR